LSSGKGEEGFIMSWQRRSVLAALCAAIGLLGGGCEVNPVTGRQELMLISVEQELAMGNRAHPSLVFMYDGEYQDPELNRYLGSIALRVHMASHRPQIPMNFTILNTSQVNAFATPGHVYATRGFLARLDNEAQFAAVVGHELAHVAARHTARAMSNSMLTSVALGSADAAIGGTLGGQIAVGAGKIGVSLAGLSYSRDQERQADRAGTYYMALAGYDARQAIEMQKVLAEIGDREESALDRYLSTHPVYSDRVRNIRAIIEEKNLIRGGYIQGDGTFAGRWRARLKRLREIEEAFVAYDRGMEELRREDYRPSLAFAQEALDMQENQAPFHRLRGDALLGLDRPSDAATSYRRALMYDPRYVPANVGLGRAYLAQDKNAAAESEFRIAAEGYPASATAKYGLGIALYSQDKFREAIPALRPIADAFPNLPMPRYILAVCYDRTGQYAAAYRGYVDALGAGLADPERRDAIKRARQLQGAAD
jgi:predicted Zn-dependent protease